MRALLLTACTLVLALPTIANCQVVCQVIQAFPCPPVEIAACDQLMSCVFDPAWDDLQCTGKARANTGEFYYGIYPLPLANLVTCLPITSGPSGASKNEPATMTALGLANSYGFGGVNGILQSHGLTLGQNM